jgi:hypothetical protein
MTIAMTMTESQISIFFLQPSITVHFLTKIVNKTQPTLYNSDNMTKGSQKEEGRQLNYIENTSAQHAKQRITYILAFHFNVLRRELEEVP